MENSIITDAQYYAPYGENLGIFAYFNGKKIDVPLDPANRHYAEIMRQVEAGELTIEPADTPE